MISQAMLEAVLDQAIPEVVVVLGVDGKIEYVNHTVTGRPPEELIGEDPLDSLPEPERAERRQKLEEVLRTGKAATDHTPVQLPNGECIWLESTWIPITEGTDDVAGVVVVATEDTAVERTKSETEEPRKKVSMCAWCGKVHDDSGIWLSPQAYIEKHRDRPVSHTICRHCSEDISRRLP